MLISTPKALVAIYHEDGIAARLKQDTVIVLVSLCYDVAEFHHRSIAFYLQKCGFYSAHYAHFLFLSYETQKQFAELLFGAKLNRRI